jgi:hypothetical protein
MVAARKSSRAAWPHILRGPGREFGVARAMPMRLYRSSWSENVSPARSDPEDVVSMAGQFARACWTDRRHMPQSLLVAVKAPSTRWASDAVSLFFSGSDRCAQVAASSAQPRWLISATRLSRNSADVSGPSAGESDFERTFASRRMVRGARLCRRQEFSRPCSFPLRFSIPDVLEVGLSRSGASRSSSPAIPTNVNKA